MNEYTDRDDWRHRAACRGNNLARWFFAPDGERQPQRERRETGAKKICDTCPVINSCEAFALGFPKLLQGVWAGMNEDELAAARRRARRWSAA